MIHRNSNGGSKHVETIFDWGNHSIQQNYLRLMDQSFDPPNLWNNYLSSRSENIQLLREASLNMQGEDLKTTLSFEVSFQNESWTCKHRASIFVFVSLPCHPFLLASLLSFPLHCPLHLFLLLLLCLISCPFFLLRFLSHGMSLSALLKSPQPRILSLNFTLTLVVVYTFDH